MVTRPSPRPFLVLVLLMAILVTGAGLLCPSPVMAQDMQPRAYLPLVLKPVPVSILGNHTLVDRGDEIFVYGEVQNSGNASLTLVKVYVDFYNPSGQLVGSKNSWVKIDDLPPGDRSCFRIWLYTSDPYPTGWSYYRLRTDTYWPDGQPLPPLTVVSHSGWYYPSDQTYLLNGTIRNDDTVTLRAPQVVATMYDSQNRVVNCDTYEGTSATTMAPGESRPFNILSFGAHLAGVNSYRLQTDGTR